MKFSLIITTLNRGFEFNRMINSLLESNNIQFIKKVVILDQSETDIFNNNIKLTSRLNESCELIHSKINKSSLSKARNEALKFLDKNDEILCFPDDDCWYKPNFFKEMSEKVSLSNADIIQTYYREEEVEGRKPTNKIINKNNAKYLKPCSVGIFINLKKINFNEIYFDELLSVGALLPGGEESDLLFRLLLDYEIEQITTPYVYHKVMRERLKKPSYKIHAARFYVMLKNRKISDIKKRLIFSIIKSILILPFDYRNFFGKVYACKLWLTK
ncbi:glycosyltransferase family 2 protein [Acinetobacter sp. G11]|uniref:glycosyltransferase family 2 protein n=1 Tax=Acinetobacter sp. G11 TaxID=3415989 RepID=UPI003C7D7DE7